jgi:hypothetical protein
LSKKEKTKKNLDTDLERKNSEYEEEIGAAIKNNVFI